MMGSWKINLFNLALLAILLSNMLRFYLSELSCSYRLSEFPTKMISSRGMVLM